MSYIGTFIGGTFVPSDEVSEARFCSLRNLPPIRKDQLFLIERALEQRRIFYSGGSGSAGDRSERRLIATL
jgi:hypothetical protein